MLPEYQSSNIGRPIVKTKIRESHTSAALRPLQVSLAKPGLFIMPYEEISESKELKKNLGMKTGIHWKRYKNVGRIFIFTEFMRPIRERDRGDHLVMSCLT